MPATGDRLWSVFLRQGADKELSKVLYTWQEVELEFETTWSDFSLWCLTGIEGA